MRSPYVGISGFMSAAEVRAALAALPQCGRQLMVGVLVSEKTLSGRRNRYPRRYPVIDDAAGVFLDDPRCLNLVHYSADTPPMWPILQLLLEVAGPRCDGFQWNGARPLRADLIALDCRAGRSLRHVYQVRTEPRIAWPARDRSWATDVLLDASGGTARAIHPERAATLYQVARDFLGEEIGIGVAGGLSAEALPQFGDVMRAGASIDAEGGLRDGPDGGDMNLEKVAAYLAAAGAAMIGRAS